MARSLSAHRRFVGRAGIGEPSTSGRGRGASRRWGRRSRALTWGIALVVLAVAVLDLPFLPPLTGARPPAAEAAVSAPPTLVDRTAGGQAADSVAMEGTSVSDDGRFVAFTSLASNLNTAVTNGDRHVYVKDRQTGAVTWVDHGDATRFSGGLAIADNAVISGNGRFVLFNGRGPGLGTPAPDQTLFLYDRQTDTYENLAKDLVGTPVFADHFSISDDGGVIAFVSSAPNIVAGLTPDATGHAQAYRLVRSTGVVTLASKTPAGDRSNGTALHAYLSGDARRIFFDSTATDLVTPFAAQPRHSSANESDRSDVYVFDVDFGQVGLVSQKDPFSPLPGRSFLNGANPVSDDGERVALLTNADLTVALSGIGLGIVDVNGTATDAVLGTSPGFSTITQYGVRGLLSRSRPSDKHTCSDPNGSASSASLSGDGQTAVFGSICPELMDQTLVTGPARDFYVVKTSPDDAYPELLSRLTSGAPSHENQGEGFPLDPAALSADGSTAVWRSNDPAVPGPHLWTAQVTGTGPSRPAIVPGAPSGDPAVLAADCGPGARGIGIASPGPTFTVTDPSGVVAPIDGAIDKAHRSARFRVTDDTPAVRRVIIALQDFGAPALVAGQRGSGSPSAVAGNVASFSWDFGAQPRAAELVGGWDDFQFGDAQAIVFCVAGTTPAAVDVSTTVKGLDSLYRQCPVGSFALTSGFENATIAEGPGNATAAFPPGTVPPASPLRTASFRRPDGLVSHTLDDTAGIDPQLRSQNQVPVRAVVVQFADPADSLTDVTTWLWDFQSFRSLPGRTVLPRPAISATARASVAALCIAAGDVERVSENGGAQGNAPSVESAVSNDGRLVLFTSRATNFTADATDGALHLFLKDRVTGTITRIDNPVDPRGGSARELGIAAISGDGTQVVYTSRNSADESGRAEILRKHDVATGFEEELERYQSVGSVRAIAVSDDSNRIVVEATSRASSSRLGGVSTGIYEYDDDSWNTVSASAEEPDGSGRAPSVSGDGRYAVYTSSSTNLVPGLTLNARHVPNTAEAEDVYRTDLVTHETVLVSGATPGSTTTTDGFGNRTIGSRQAISRDGSKVVFKTQAGAENFGGGGVTDRNGSLGEDAILADFTSGRSEVLSVYGPAFGTNAASLETCPSGGATNPSISDDGTTAVFIGSCSDYFGSGARLAPLKVVDHGLPVPVMPGPRGVPDGENPNSSPLDAEDAAVSGDGATVTWTTEAALKLADDSDDDDVYANGAVSSTSPTEPAAVDDAATVVAGSFVDVDVLANDTAVDSATLTIDQVTGGTATVVDVGGPRIHFVPAPGSTAPGLVVYSVNGSAVPTSSASAALTVTVTVPEAPTVTITSPDALPLGAAGDHLVDVAVESSSAGVVPNPVVRIDVAGATVTSVDAFIEPFDPSRGWTCTASAAPSTSVSCALNGTLAAGESFPVARLAIAVPDDVATRCTDGVASSGPCVVVQGTTTEAGGVTPANIPAPGEARLPVLTRRVAATLTVTPAPLTTGQPAAYQVVVSNPGTSAAITDPVVEVRASLPDMALVAGTGSTWTCTGIGSPVARCTSIGSLTPGSALPALVVTFTTGTGQATCPGVSGPCVRTEVVGQRGVADPNPSEVVATLETAVLAAPPGDAPDLTVKLGSAPPVKAATKEPFVASVTNAGSAATTGTSSLTIAFPTGFHPESATGQGWSCAADATARTVTCTFAGLVAARAAFPDVTMLVLLDEGAPSGSATATVATANDAVSANDTFALPIDVTPVTGGPLGRASLGLDLQGPEAIAQGQTIHIAAFAQNNGDVATAAASTITLALPDGLPAGQRFSAKAAGPGWACKTTPLKGATELRCTNPDPVKGDGGRTPALGIDLTAVAVASTGVVDLPFEVTPGGPARRRVHRLQLLSPLRAVLTTTVDAPAQLLAGKSADVDVVVADDGKGPTTAPLEVGVAIPAGLTVTGTRGKNWTCSGAARLACTNGVLLRAGTPAEKLTITLAAPPDAVEGSVKVTATAKAEDLGGPLSSQGSDTIAVANPGRTTLAIERSANELKTPPDGRASYTLAVVNDSARPVGGPFTLTETGPLGSTFDAKSADGWSCTGAAEVLTCTLAAGSFGPGVASPPLAISVDLPDRLAGTTQVVQTQVRDAKGGGAASTGSFVIASAPPPAPRLALTLGGLPTTLERGRDATGFLTVKNDGSATLPAGALVGVVIPQGVDAMRATPGITSLAACSSRIDGRTVVVCRLAQPLAVGATLGTGLALELHVASSAPDAMVLDMGEVRVTPATTPAGDLAAALDLLAGQGSAALRRKVTDSRPVVGLLAHAGAPQQAFDVTRRPDGTEVPSTVQLDGTLSRAPGGAPLTFEWVQTSGPAVTWGTVAGTKQFAPAGSPPVPFATGERPVLTPARVRGAAAVPLTFRLTVRSGTGAGAASAIADTTVTITPAPNRAPVIDTLTASAGTSSIPAAGTAITLALGAHDPDDDRLARSFLVTGGDASPGLTMQQTRGGARFVWPAGASFVTVEAKVDDGRGGVATRSITVGQAPPPVTVSANGPAIPVTPGLPVTVVAEATGAPAAQFFWVWHQVSGPPVDPAILNPAAGPFVTFPAPAARQPGDAVVLQVTGSVGQGPNARWDDATVTIRLADAPPPVVTAVGPATAPVGQPAAITATALGAGPFSFRWTQTAGPAGTLADPMAAATTFTPSADGTTVLTVTATGANGASAAATVSIRSGAVSVPDLTVAPSCAATASFVGQAFQRAQQNQPFAAEVGPVSFDLGTLTVESPCGANARLGISNASFSIAGGTLTGSGLTGFMTEAELCVTGGELSLPASWGTTAATLAPDRPICLQAAPDAPNRITGSLTVTGLPFLALPAGTAPPVTTIDFSGTTLRVVTHATLPDAATLDLDLTVQATGAFSATVAVDDVLVLGQPLDLDGSVTGSGSSFTVDVRASLPGPVEPIPGVRLSDLEVRLSTTGLSARGSGLLVAAGLQLDVNGTFVDADDWSLSVSARTGGPPLTPLPGLSFDGAQLVGTLRSVAGAVTFDVQAGIAGSWTPIGGLPLTVNQLDARFSNLTPPANCPGIAAGAPWFLLRGSATLTVGTQPIQLSVGVCAGSGNQWALTSTADFGSWKPVAGVDVTVEDVGVQVLFDGSLPTITLTGSTHVLGVSLGANVFVRPADGAIAVDAFGDLSGAGLGLSPGSVGHVVLASADIPELRFTDPVLAGVQGVDLGLNLFVGFAPDPGLKSFLSAKLGLPPVDALVLTAQLGGPDLTLKAAITLGAGGLPLFQVCPQGCGDPAKVTSLTLTEVALSLSITGRIGFSASGNLHLPASSAEAPASDLTITAEIAIDVAGPSITLALFTSDGTWHDALGLPGLDFADLAIQGGVNFASPVPTPTVGFGATIVRLPDDWARMIGADPNNQEAMSFVLNISQTAPILMMQVGVQDGHIALKPLRAITAAKDAVQIDYAKVILAPFGGTVGPYTFAPGLGFGFAATIMNVPVDVAASVQVLPPVIDAHVNVGTLPLSAVTLNGVQGSFHIDPAGLAVRLDASLSLPGQTPAPGQSATPGPTAAVDADLDANLQGIKAHFHARADNWVFGPFATITRLDVDAQAAIPTMGSAPSFALGVDAAGTVLGTAVSVGGNVTFEGASLRRADLKVGVGTFRIGPNPGGVVVGGKGCDGVTGGGDDGACVKVGYDAALGQPFSGFVSGEVTASGIVTSFSGGLDATGVQASGTILATGLGSFSASGRFYSGPPAALSGLTETLPNGTAVAVKAGDWKLKASAGTAGKLKGFDANITVAAGKLGSNVFVSGAADVTLFGNTAAVSGLFGSSGGELVFHIEADVDLSLDGFAASAGHLVIDSVTGVSFRARLTMKGFGASFLRVGISGSFTPRRSARPGVPAVPAAYDLAVTGTFDIATGNARATQLLGVDVDFSGRLTNASFEFDVDLDSGPFDLTLHGFADSTMKLCASVATSISIPGPNLDADVSFCNKGTPQETGFRISVGVNGYNFVAVKITVPAFTLSKRFGPYGGSSSVLVTSLNPFDWKDDFRVGASFDFDVDVTISTTAAPSLVGSGSASAYFKHWVDTDNRFFEEDWEFVREELGSVDMTIDTRERVACATVGLFGLDTEVCA